MQKLLTIFLLISFSCQQKEAREKPNIVQPGAHQLEEYLPMLERKNVALTINHSSLIDSIPLADVLMEKGVQVGKVFTPEHGFFGTVSDGEFISYEEQYAPFQMVSLYGENKKPTTEQMQGIDIMVFDIQDVGARFYTYISTLHYVMQACAEAEIPLIVLDRPNPNGSYVDGPVLDLDYQSFVGMHPIPVVYGMTIGELATMVNEEGWLGDGVRADLRIVKIKNWDHKQTYPLPVKPSPNLPNELSISLYPSLCLFEGTIMSVGRGTEHPFQQVGHPDYPEALHGFIPQSMEGSKYPPYEELQCYGLSWINQKPTYEFTLDPLIEAYTKMNREDFFNDYFTKLAGSTLLQKQIEAGLTEKEIRATWKEDLKAFKELREKYLLYK